MTVQDRFPAFRFLSFRTGASSQLSRKDAPRRMLAPWPAATAVLAGQAMASLDAAIVNVAGPAFSRDLRMSGAELQLAIYTYLLAYAAALVTGARLGARHGFGRLFGYGLAMFTVSSLACGLAVNPVMLVTARAAQGIGAALLVPQVLSLLQVTFDGERRRRAMSLYGLVLAVGVAVGQVLGGVLVSANLFGFGWRPVFLVNVPVGLVVLALAAGRLPAGQRAGRARLDLAGVAWLATGILALVVPLTFGADAGWPAWSWPVAAAGVFALAVFTRHERALAAAGREPLVDPAVVAGPGVRTGLAGIFTLHSSYGGLLFTTAVYLQQQEHDSPLRSGLTFAGYAAGFATASVGWTRLPASWQPRLPLLAFTLFTATVGLLAWLTSGDGWPWSATALLVIGGAAHGAGFDALVHRTAASVPAPLAPAFSGVLATVNQAAIIAGIALSGTVYLAAARGAGASPMTAVLIVIGAVLTLGGAQEVGALATRARSGPRSNEERTFGSWRR